MAPRSDGGATLGRKGYGADWLLMAAKVKDGASLQKVEQFYAAIEGRRREAITAWVKGYLEF